MNKIVDPWRMPGMWREAFRSDFDTLGDKLRVMRLRSRLKRTSIDDIFRRAAEVVLADLSRVRRGNIFRSPQSFLAFSTRILREALRYY